jgi:hypothetical protein
MAAAAGRVKLRQAIDPLVLAVDIGSTASRGGVYDQRDVRSRGLGRRFRTTSRPVMTAPQR